MSLFHIRSHIIPAAHLHTEHPRATISGYTAPPELKLAVKQYTPLSPTTDLPHLTHVTVIFCHANGFHKEVYEPYFDDLLKQCESLGVKIKNIWAPDAVHQGASGVLNDYVLGDDPSWNDLPRDILHMVNVFREHIVPPVVGIGHSYGGHAVVRTSLMHPALFHCLVLIDPVIYDESEGFQPGSHPAKLSARRKDIWASQEEAEEYFGSRPFYQRWDSRVLALHTKYGLRPLPSATYPNSKGVTLATTKAQEVYTFLRINSESRSVAQLERPEPSQTFRSLGYLVPPVLYITGGRSPVSLPSSNEHKLQQTPTAKLVVIKEAGHLIPQEEPTKAAAETVPFLAAQINRWGAEAEADAKTPRRRHLSDDFLSILSKI